MDEVDEHNVKKNEQNEQNMEILTFPCQWPECKSAPFQSELDMGLHVLAAHTKILKHGHFVLTSGPGAEEQVEQTPPRKRIRTQRSSRENWSRENARTPRRQEEELKWSQVAVNLLRKLQRPTKERLFKTTDFCVICQINYKRPCNINHNTKEVQLVAEWKRIYGHLTPKKKAMITQLRKMKDDLLEREKRGDNSLKFIVKVEPTDVPDEDEEAPDQNALEEEAPESATAPTQHLETPARHDPADVPEDEGAPAHDALEENAHEAAAAPTQHPETSAHHVPEGEEQETHELDLSPDVIPHSRESRFAILKISRIISSLTVKLRTHSSFHSMDRSNFCLMCLSFGECEKEHSAYERRIENTWIKYYGTGWITPERLIEQLKHVQERYLRIGHEE